jgi:hypothetical protein
LFTPLNIPYFLARLSTDFALRSKISDFKRQMSDRSPRWTTI